MDINKMHNRGIMGLPGCPGPRGPKGCRGKRGKRGKKGDTGPTGPTIPPNCCPLTYVDREPSSKGDVVEVVPCTGAKAAQVIKCDPNKLSNWEWASKAGGVNSLARGIEIDTDGDGNAYVVGFFSETITFGNLPPLQSSGSFDIFVAKIDKNGQWIWATKAGGVQLDSAEGVYVDYQGNSYVTGNFRDTATFGNIQLVSSSTSANVFLAKIDTNGVWQWAVRAGGDENNFSGGLSVTQDCNGNSYIVGTYSQNITFGTLPPLTSSSENEMFVAKADPLGTWLWAIQPEDEDRAVGKAISADCKNNVYVTGIFTGTVTFGTLPPITAVGNADGFVTKINSEGIWQWVSQAGGDEAVSGNITSPQSIATDKCGNSYITGQFQETTKFNDLPPLVAEEGADVFIAKIGSMGDWIWANQVRGSGSNDVGNSIRIDCNGNTYITGTYTETLIFSASIQITSTGGLEIFAAKADSNGVWQWALSAGGSTSDQGIGIGIDCYGNTLYTGLFTQTAIFGELPPLEADGDSDIFVAKINTDLIGVTGFLKEDAVTDQVVEVCFAGGVSLSDVFAELLKVGCNYYMGKDCELTNCCKCTKFIGVALTPNKIMSGVAEPCHKCPC